MSTSPSISDLTWPSSPGLSDHRPSSPLTFWSRSPSPPPCWRIQTPPASQNADDDMPRPRKRRKLERSARTTQYLDLTSDTAQSVYDREEAISTLQKALEGRKKIVVIAGAGVSVSAGIPDFRSSHGLFKTLKSENGLRTSGKELFDASVYKDGESTAQFHNMVRELAKLSRGAKPTIFHHLLAKLADQGRLLRLYTQNVDGLETRMPQLATEVPLPARAPWPQTIQLHGGLEKMTCQKCRTITDFEADLFDGEETPRCPMCQRNDEIRTNEQGRRSHGIGRLRPRMVLYTEQNPDEEAIGAVCAADLRTRPDAVIVVGTSMKIPGVRRLVSEMCKVVRDRREGTTVWINPDPEPTGQLFDDCWDLIVKGRSDEVAVLSGFEHWSNDEQKEYADSDMERIMSSQALISIDLPLSPLKAVIRQVATPPASNHGTEKKMMMTTTPARIKLNLSQRSLENDKARSFSVDLPKPRKNPASSSKKLADILGNSVKASKPKTSRSQGSKAAERNTSITKFAKVTKARPAGQASVKLGKHEVLPTPSETTDSPTPSIGPGGVQPTTEERPSVFQRVSIGRLLNKSDDVVVHVVPKGVADLIH